MILISSIQWLIRISFRWNVLFVWTGIPRLHQPAKLSKCRDWGWPEISARNQLRIQKSMNILWLYLIIASKLFKRSSKLTSDISARKNESIKCSLLHHVFVLRIPPLPRTVNSKLIVPYQMKSVASLTLVKFYLREGRVCRICSPLFE